MTVLFFGRRGKSWNRWVLVMSSDKTPDFPLERTSMLFLTLLRKPWPRSNPVPTWATWIHVASVTHRAVVAACPVRASVQPSALGLTFPETRDFDLHVPFRPRVARVAGIRGCEKRRKYSFPPPVPWCNRPRICFGSRTAVSRGADPLLSWALGHPASPRAVCRPSPHV